MAAGDTTVGSTPEWAAKAGERPKSGAISCRPTEKRNHCMVPRKYREPVVFARKRFSGKVFSYFSADPIVRH